MDSKALEVDDNEEDQESGEEVVEVGGSLPVEGMVEGPHFVRSSQQQVHTGYHTPFEFSALVTLNCYGGKGLPHYPFTHIHCYEQGYA